jgi:hypothetical protein
MYLRWTLNLEICNQKMSAINEHKCIRIVCLCMTTLNEVFPCFFLSCKANIRVKPAKTGHDLHSSKFLCCFMYFCVVLCIFVFYVHLWYSMYFCIVLCTLCVVLLFLYCSMSFLCCSMYFCVVLCIVCLVPFSVLFVCICVLYHCHRVATQLQLNISYHIISNEPAYNDIDLCDISSIKSDNLWYQFTAHC